MEETRSFAPLLLVILLAFVVPLVLSRFKRLRLPIVVGEILAGIVIGRSGFGWVQQHDPVLDMLAEFGFVFLMFLSGMEVDFSNIGFSRPGRSRKGNSWGPLQLGGLSFVITLALSAVLGYGLLKADLVNNPWMMALILSTTSLGVVMPVLKERGMSAGFYGQTLLVSALIADFATMLLITVVVTALSTGLTFEILHIGLLFVAFFLMYHFGMFFFNRIGAVRQAMEELSHASSQIKVRAAFTMMLVFVVFSELLGAEVILGAFLAGAIVALLRRPEDADLVGKLEAIGFGFFIPIFFVMVGVDFNLNALVGSPQAMLLVPVLLLAAIGVKFIPALVYRIRFSWRESFGAGALLSARLSLIIAASAIGLRMGVISEPVNAAVILVAVLTVTGAPMLFIRLAPEQEDGQDRPILVAGTQDLGLRVAEQLRAHNEPVVVIDSDPQGVARAREFGLEAVVADMDRPDPAAEPYLEQARALVCTNLDTDLNYRICQLAHLHYGIDDMVAQVNEAGEIGRFESLGVTVHNAAVDRAHMLAMLARNPAAYHLLTRADDDKEVVEVLVREGYCDGKRLTELGLPGDVLVLALRRNGELTIPHGDTRLNCGDHLTLAGTLDSIESARMMFSEVKWQ
jgi:Kef-type K+ transport system membrane component KefB/Trk K+ transport system NAD-binding subunit